MAEQASNGIWRNISDTNTSGNTGEDADRKFLRKLSLRNDGFMRHIYEAADAALQLRDFYRQVSSPLLADVKFVYPSSQVRHHFCKQLTKSVYTECFFDYLFSLKVRKF